MLKKLHLWLAGILERRAALAAFNKQRRSNYSYWLNNGAASKIEDALTAYAYNADGRPYMCIALRYVNPDPKYFGYDALFVNHAVSLVSARIGYHISLYSYLVDTTPKPTRAHPNDHYGYKKDHSDLVPNVFQEPAKFISKTGIPFYRKMIKDIRRANLFP